MVACLTESKELKDEYRKLLVAKFRGQDYDAAELQRLIDELGISELEFEQHTQNCAMFVQCVDFHNQVSDIKRNTIPSLVAKLNEIDARHADIIPHSRKQVAAMEAERLAVKTELDAARNTACDGNRNFWELNQLICPDWQAEVESVRSDREKLKEKAAKLREDLRPETQPKAVSVTSDAGSYTAMKNYPLDETHWSNIAKYSDSDAERRKANAKLLEIARAKRQLADAESEIESLSQVIAELEARPIEAHLFAI
jgi:hypothetical protein